MRSRMLMGTAAAVLTASTLLAAPASADRFCRKECHDGICKSTCVDRGDHLYMSDRDRDYYHHRRGVELRGPGVNIDVGR